jgi:molybdopterin molybdotransferase
MRSSLIEIDDAQRVVLERTQRLEHEPVALADALGRVLAVNIASSDAVPRFESSSMDGFAVRFGDVLGARAAAPVTLELSGESRAGRPAAGVLERGQAIAISTGAVMPAGADAVVALEQTDRRDGHVEVREEVARGTNVRLVGEDIRAGQTVLAAGATLGAAELGVLASLGHAEVRCTRRPRVCVITTGDELVAPGTPLRSGQIYNSNAYSIPALVHAAGVQLALVATARDEPAATRAVIAEALERGDVVALCGGVSVGAHDHVKQALAELGVQQAFWGVALKPGKPTWFGTRERQLVFGLPGNPVSAMVTFHLFVAPALRAMSGCASVSRRASARLARDYAKPAGRAHALRCRLRVTDGGYEADCAGDTGSHVLTSMLGADALAIIPTGAQLVRAGERVDVELLGCGA